MTSGEIWLRSHSATSLSLAVRSMVVSGTKARTFATVLWPTRGGPAAVPSSRHKVTVPSSWDVATRAPSGLNASSFAATGRGGARLASRDDVVELDESET